MPVNAELNRWIDYLFVCVKRHIHRYGYRMTQASGTLNQMYVSLEEARRLLSRPEPASNAPQALGLPVPEELAEQVAEYETWLGALPADSATVQLQNRFGLDRDSLRILLAAAGPLISVDLSRLYSFAWADFAVKLPSVGFLTELLSGDGTEAVGLQAAFHPSAPLMRYQLIQLRDAGPWGTPSPNLHRGVVVSEAILSFLAGQLGALPARLAAASTLSSAQSAMPPAGLHLDASARKQLEVAIAEAIAPTRPLRPRPLLIGPTGSGRRTAVGALAAAHGWGLLSVDLSRLARNGEGFADELAGASREALLRRTVLFLRGDELFDDAELWGTHGNAITSIVSGHAGPVVCSSRVSMGAINRAIGGVVDIAFPLPKAAQQRAVWYEVLASGGHPDDKELALELGQRFSVSPGTVHGAVNEARTRRALNGLTGPLAAEDVAQAVRRRLEHALSQVAEPFSTSLTWDDVVFPKDVMDKLEEILSQARHRERVYDDWGFRRKMAYGRGLGCLFCGPPGTGKTMVAGLIARSLGRECYKVDLSRVVSKWVGETEKNLARVFDEAERAQVILLFDEADSLFSSRTEVKGSNDRFANMEVNYLLQRMESYDGMSLLTTNFEKSIDEAFKRRLKFKIDFPLPEAPERTMLWRVMMPDRAEVADDIRYEYLAKKFKLSGGNIKNAVLRAAFYAAEADSAITHELLERAALAEAREMGRLM